MGKKAQKKKILQEAKAKVDLLFEFFYGDFKTTHSLKIEFFKWESPFPIPGKKPVKYQVGTVAGIMSFNDESFELIAITNDLPGNGHLQDLFDWFEEAGKVFKMDLVVAETWNAKFKKHLIYKRGFTEFRHDYLIKKFTNA